MIGLDTNVLVRFFAQDDERQTALANLIVEAFNPDNPGFVSTVALVETTWVLARTYRRSRAEIGEIVETLLGANEIVVEDADLHHLALDTFRAGSVDYADAVIAQASRRAGCTEVVTFDRLAARTAGMRLLA